MDRLTFPNAHIHLNKDENINKLNEYSIINSTSISDIERLYNKIKQAKDRNLFLMGGIHPWFLSKESDENIITLEKIIKRGIIRGIGECGLDFSKNRTNSPYLTKKNQIKILKKQLLLAQKFTLPLTLHSVKAWNNIIELLKEIKLEKPVIFHHFTGSKEILRELSKITNCYFSFAPLILKNSKKNHIILKELKLNQLLLEDEKQLENRGTLLLESYKLISDIKGIKIEELKREMKNNIKKIFK